MAIWPPKLGTLYKVSSEQPRSQGLSSASFGRWKKETGCGWSWDHLESGWQKYDFQEYYSLAGHIESLSRSPLKGSLKGVKGKKRGEREGDSIKNANCRQTAVNRSKLYTCPTMSCIPNSQFRCSGEFRGLVMGAKTPKCRSRGIKINYCSFQRWHKRGKITPLAKSSFLYS